jgi:hypothetical protein
MNPLAERRVLSRARIFKNAAIVLNGRSPRLECAARDLSPQGVRLCLSTTYGIPQQFDVLIDGKCRRGRSVWRTCTEMGVIFLDASRQSFVSAEGGRDIAPLIELLRMAEEKWPSSESSEVSEIELLRRDQTLLEMWPEACRRTGIEPHEFPIGVIRRWQQKMGWAN